MSHFEDSVCIIRIYCDFSVQNDRCDEGTICMLYEVTVQCPTGQPCDPVRHEFICEPGTVNLCIDKNMQTTYNLVCIHVLNHANWIR